MLTSSSHRHCIYKRLPALVDSRKRYIFYLHDKVVEDQGTVAQHPDYGAYEYGSILEALRDAGFHVVSETRPKGTHTLAYAKKVAEDINDLIRAWVPPEHITIIGASKGAFIAGLVSALLKKEGLNYVLLSFTKDETYTYFCEQGLRLTGNVLSIYEASDTAAESCQQFREISPTLLRFSEIELHMGIGHSIHYQAHNEWLSPALQWARGHYNIV